MPVRHDSDAPDQLQYRHNSEEGEPHGLDGVEMDEPVVRQLAAVVDRPLAQKLERALFFRAEMVALTREEKDAVTAALNRDRREPKDVRERLLAPAGWGELAELI